MDFSNYFTHFKLSQSERGWGRPPDPFPARLPGQIRYQEIKVGALNNLTVLLFRNLICNYYAF